ncbi:unnamed protein product [Amoebophrya sp. A25]|nr:unnamed protein product [Amoebophrya sp. A25]|eukprot:GSA25T00015437001.1
MEWLPATHAFGNVGGLKNIADSVILPGEVDVLEGDEDDAHAHASSTTAKTTTSTPVLTRPTRTKQRKRRSKTSFASPSQVHLMDGLQYGGFVFDTNMLHGAHMHVFPREIRKTRRVFILDFAAMRHMEELPRTGLSERETEKMRQRGDENVNSGGRIPDDLCPSENHPDRVRWAYGMQNVAEWKKSRARLLMNRSAASTPAPLGEYLDADDQSTAPAAALGRLIREGGIQQEISFPRKLAGAVASTPSASSDSNDNHHQDQEQRDFYRLRSAQYVSSDWERWWQDSIDRVEKERSICSALVDESEELRPKLAHFMTLTGCDEVDDKKIISYSTRRIKFFGDGWCRVSRNIAGVDAASTTLLKDDNKQNQGYYFHPEKFRFRRSMPLPLVTKDEQVHAIILKEEVRELHYDPTVFSRFEYVYEKVGVLLAGPGGHKNEANRQLHIQREFIEPLVGHLRHPLAGCEEHLFWETDREETTSTTSTAKATGGAATATDNKPITSNIEQGFFVSDSSYVMPLPPDSVLLPSTRPSTTTSSTRLYLDFGAGQYAEHNVSRTFTTLIGAWERHAEMKFDAVAGWEPNVVMDGTDDSKKNRVDTPANTTRTAFKRHFFETLPEHLRERIIMATKSEDSTSTSTQLVPSTPQQLRFDLHTNGLTEFPARPHSWLPCLVKAKQAVQQENYNDKTLKNQHTSYTLVKLDIDVNVVENAVVDSILDEPLEDRYSFARRAPVIQEFLWEHHVNNYLMNPYWLETGYQSQESIADSHRKFYRLRKEKLIRAHSWV